MNMNSMREYFCLCLQLGTVFFIVLCIGAIGMGIYGETTVTVGVFTLGLMGLLVTAMGGLGFAFCNCEHLLIPAAQREVDFLEDPVVEPGQAAVFIHPSLMHATPPMYAAAEIPIYVEYRRAISTTPIPLPLANQEVVELQEYKNSRI